MSSSDSKSPLQNVGSPTVPDLTKTKQMQKPMISKPKAGKSMIAVTKLTTFEVSDSLEVKTQGGD